MGVYIRGIEMPTSCRACLCSRTDIRNVDWCVLAGKDLPCDCPLIYVPPHGRLGDLDKIENEIARLAPEDYTTGGIRLVLDDAPTVIPAEEKSDD